MKKRDNKLAIVLSGGGMRCAHGAGLLYGLGTKLPHIKPDIIIAASGAAGAATYYLTGQCSEIKEVWTKILPKNKNFLSFLRIPFMDVDYLIDDVLHTMVPLDVEKLKNVVTDYFLPVRSIHSGKLSYLGNSHSFAAYECLRAAKAIPVVYNKNVTLNHDNYIDGFVGVSTITLIQKAVEEGATKILVIRDNTNRDQVQWFFTFILFRFFLKKKIVACIKRDKKAEAKYLVPAFIELKTIDFSPSDVSLFDNSYNVMSRSFMSGESKIHPEAEVWKFINRV